MSFPGIPFWYISAGVYCFGDSEDLLQAVVGSALGEVLMFIPVNLASPDSSSVWAYQFAYEIAIPSLRTCATILLAYRLWCEHQVQSGLGKPVSQSTPPPPLSLQHALLICRLYPMDWACLQRRQTTRSSVSASRTRLVMKTTPAHR